MHATICRRLLRLVFMSLPALMVPSVWAQTTKWPNHPIKLIVPYPAGGNSDAIARYVGDRLGQALGQPVVIENKAGAGATIGAEAVAHASGDGYTLLLAPTAVLAITPQLRKVAYDPMTDLVPIAKLSGSYSIVTARKDAPFNNMKEMVAAAQREPGKLTYGSAGPATATHIAGELINYQAHIQTLHVPFKGSAPALNELIAGRIDLIYDPIGLSQIKAGHVKAIAVLSKMRHPELPDVPTMAEQGYQIDTRSWFGLFAPKGTPTQIITRMAGELQKFMTSPEASRTLLQVSQYPDFVAPDAFSRQILEDSQAFKDLITKANIRVE